MKLSRYKAAFDEAVSDLTPEQMDEMEVVSSSDDEGNSFGVVHFTPAVGNHEHCTFHNEAESEEYSLPINAICIN